MSRADLRKGMNNSSERESQAVCTLRTQVRPAALAR